MKWVEFLKKWSKDKGIKYSEAMKDPKAKAAYQKQKGGDDKGKKGKGKKGEEDEKEVKGKKGKKM